MSRAVLLQLVIMSETPIKIEFPALFAATQASGILFQPSGIVLAIQHSLQNMWWHFVMPHGATRCHTTTLYCCLKYSYRQAMLANVPVHSRIGNVRPKIRLSSKIDECVTIETESPSDLCRPWLHLLHPVACRWFIRLNATSICIIILEVLECFTFMTGFQPLSRQSCCPYHKRNKHGSHDRCVKQRRKRRYDYSFHSHSFPLLLVAPAGARVIEEHSTAGAVDPSGSRASANLILRKHSEYEARPIYKIAMEGTNGQTRP